LIFSIESFSDHRASILGKELPSTGLDPVIKMQVMLETLLGEYLKPVLESPDAYLPN
jgi:hypothetical protein